MELKVKSYESESSLQINQTELALSRLTTLRSQLIQLQNNNEKMEEFLARFKSTGMKYTFDEETLSFISEVKKSALGVR